MPRVPYINPAPGESPVADKIRERRKNGELIPLDQVLLNAPHIAAGYSALLGAVRAQNSLDGALRELLILRVAALNGAAYEWKAHEPVGRQGGLTTPQLREIRAVDDVGYGPQWRTESYHKNEDKDDGNALTPLMRAALEFTDASTRGIKVPNEVFEKLREAVRGSLREEYRVKEVSEDKEEFEKKVNQQLVEIAATVGSYNLVSRFLVSMDVGDMAEVEVPKFD